MTTETTIPAEIDECEQSYTLEMRDGASEETIEFGAAPSAEECEAQCAEWCKGGDWGRDGASIDILWTLFDAQGEEIDSGSTTVEIEPDHESLIAAAAGFCWDEGGKTINGCGASPDDHDWTREGEGGCESNPGVRSTGGTSMSFASHCKTCGLRRSEHSTGSQRNPGEHDTVSYEMPETWCAECAREDCRHNVESDVTLYSDCDDDFPGGDYQCGGFTSQESARQEAIRIAHADNVRHPDKVIVAKDDTGDGDGDYHVFVVS